MKKQVIISTIAVFVAWMVMDSVIHGVILGGTYERTASLWRPMAEMKHGQMAIVTLITALMFCLIFVRMFGEKSVERGIEYGLYFGIATGVGGGNPYTELAEEPGQDRAESQQKPASSANSRASRNGHAPNGRHDVSDQQVFTSM